jgi:hypothetical protein
MEDEAGKMTELGKLEVLEAAQAIVSGSGDPIALAREIMRLAASMGPEVPGLDYVRAVDSDSDAWPFDQSRGLWEPHALALADDDKRQYLLTVMPDLVAAATSLGEYLREDARAELRHVPSRDAVEPSRETAERIVRGVLSDVVTRSEAASWADAWMRSGSAARISADVWGVLELLGCADACDDSSNDLISSDELRRAMSGSSQRDGVVK